MFASDRIESRFRSEANAFLEETHLSVISHSIVEHLLSEEGPVKYGGDNRNVAVQMLEKDVTNTTGLSANLMFCTEGHLHDCLQTLMDAYWNAIDGIYYKEETSSVNPEMCFRH
jgi:hypothetical protein